MHMYLCCLCTVHVVITCSCVWVCELKNLKPSTQNCGSQAKQWPWEESEGIYWQPHLQKRMTYSVYCEPRMTWTDLHHHQQRTSSSSMPMSSNTNIRKSTNNFVKYCTHMYNHFLCFLQVKNKPYQLREKYASIFGCGVVTNIYTLQANFLQYRILLDMMIVFFFSLIYHYVSWDPQYLMLSVN
jgi:hypothetical protein